MGMSEVSCSWAYQKATTPPLELLTGDSKATPFLPSATSATSLPTTSPQPQVSSFYEDAGYQCLGTARYTQTSKDDEHTLSTTRY